MDLLLLIVFQVIILSVVGGYFYRLYRGTLPEPDSTDLVYKARGGGSVSMDSVSLYQHLSWPFVAIYLYKDKLLLNFGGRKVNLRYSDITKVEKGMNGVRIYHTNTNQPAFVSFSGGKSNEIIKQIESGINQSV